jgi:hypothetical protein
MRHPPATMNGRRLILRAMYIALRISLLPFIVNCDFEWSQEILWFALQFHHPERCGR